MPIGIVLRFDQNVADAVFPVMGGFDFDDLFIRQQVNWPIGTGGFGEAADFGLEPVAHEPLGLAAAVGHDPVG